MLHVKHRHVLVNGHFKPLGRRRLQERLKLHGIQIIRSSDSLQAEAVDEIIGRERVSDVQRKISNTPRAGEILQVIVVANQVAVGFAGADLL